MIQFLKLNADEIEPFVTWGTNPSMGSGISAQCSLREGF